LCRIELQTKKALIGGLRRVRTPPIFGREGRKGRGWREGKGKGGKEGLIFTSFDGPLCQECSYGKIVKIYLSFFTFQSIMLGIFF